MKSHPMDTGMSWSRHKRQNYFVQTSEKPNRFLKTHGCARPGLSGAWLHHYPGNPLGSTDFGRRRLYV